MNISHVELASATTTVEELMARVSRAADSFQDAGDEATAGELYDVERSLGAAGRRLTTIVHRLEMGAKR